MKRTGTFLLALMMAGTLGLGIWLAGCAANDPFDPASVANQPPHVQFFVGPVIPGGDLNPTSYFKRKFSWSGTDPDGWVTEYSISIRSQRDVSAPWITTTRTDTTMTFITGEDGTAEATFYLACKDNRGAASDTVVQFVPLRNFPPVVNFQSDFEPRVNMQREITSAGQAGADTTYWNWGVSNFRLFALDLDGAATMEDSYLYTLADGDPEQVYDVDDPLADPNSTWVRQPFPDLSSEVRDFDIQIKNASPGERTLRVKVRDEAQGEALFSYTWEVRPAKGRVLYIFDNSSSVGRVFYRGFMDEHFGADNWDTYDFWFGFPDRPYVLLETMRLFDLVIWTDGGSNSNILVKAAGRDGVLQQYVQGSDTAAPGKFLLITKAVAGSASRLPAVFVQSVLGITPSPAPPSEFGGIAGMKALGEASYLPDLTAVGNGVLGLGIVPLNGSDILYRMEYCENCYGDPRRPRPPFDPVVAVRKPERAVSGFAQVVTVSLMLDQFDPVEAKAGLAALLDNELGVTP